MPSVYFRLNRKLLISIQHDHTMLPWDSATIREWFFFFFIIKIIIQDDDTVVDCVQPHNGPGKVQISFNDATFNEVLPQASSVLLKDTSSLLEDGVLTCSAKLLLDNRQLAYNDSQFKVHDLETGSYYLLFARGNADQFSTCAL